MATDYLDLAKQAVLEEKSKWQIWYANPKNRARVLAEQAARKAADPAAYSAKKREQYHKNHAHYRAYQKKYYDENKETILAYQKRKQRTLNALFKKAMSSARSRGHSWSLTIGELAELRKNRCHYCGGPLPQSGHGLDRKDSNLGYEIGNVLPCCFDCNKHKADSWTVEEAEVAIRAVISLREGK